MIGLIIVIYYYGFNHVYILRMITFCKRFFALSIHAIKYKYL